MYNGLNVSPVFQSSIHYFLLLVLLAPMYNRLNVSLVFQSSIHYFLLQISALERLKKCELPPSSKLCGKDAVDVLGYMFGKHFREYRDAIQYLTSNKSAPTIKQTLPVCLQRASDCYKIFENQYRRILNLSIKEASTFWMLGDWLGEVSDLLKNKYPEWEFRTDPEYYVLDGKTFAADEVIVGNQDQVDEGEAAAVSQDEGEATLPAAIEALNLETSTSKPILITECKPRVSTNLQAQEPFHITETLIQAFYVRRKYDFPILHCLTDLKEYHFFLVGDAPNQKLELLWYFHLCCDLKKPNELAQLLSFLYDVVQL